MKVSGLMTKYGDVLPQLESPDEGSKYAIDPRILYPDSEVFRAT